jgi:predicted phage tail protein
MLRTIRIYGALARFLKRRVFRADVANAAEAVRFLLANFPQLEQHMADQYYEVRVGSRALQLGDDPAELHAPTGSKEVISIIPVMAGAGSSGGQVLAGIGLIAAAIITGGIASAGVALGGFMGIGTVGTVVAGIGASLALGGIAQMLTPTPELNSGSSYGQDSDTDPRRSYSFSGVQNVSRQGIPVPIVYGEIIVGSIVISAGTSTEKVTA